MSDQRELIGALSANSAGRRRVGLANGSRRAPCKAPRASFSAQRD